MVRRAAAAASWCRRRPSTSPHPRPPPPPPPRQPAWQHAWLVSGPALDRLASGRVLVGLAGSALAVANAYRDNGLGASRGATA